MWYRLPWLASKKPKNVCTDFIELYGKYLEEVTDAPPEYHEPTSMFILAAVLDRQLYMRFNVGYRYPNMWVMLLGDSTLTRKSTCQNMAKDILTEVAAKTRLNRLADDSTPEGLIDLLSLKPRGFWIRDEVSGFIASLKRDYMTGMKELLILIYDCIDHYEKHLTKKHYTLSKVYTCFLAGTTPKSFHDKIASEDFYTGFLARWLVFDGEFNKDRWKGIEQFSEEDNETRNILISTLIYIHSMFTGTVEATMDEKTLDYYNSWSKSNQFELFEHENRSELSPFYGRLEEYVVKISMIYEVSNVDRLHRQMELSRKHIIIHKDSLTKAIKFIEKYKREMLPELMSKANETKANKILLIIQDAGEEGVQHSAVLRRSHLSARELKECINTLDESEKISITETKDGRKRKKIYRVV